MNRQKQFILNIFGREPKTLDELAECCIQVGNTYKDSSYKHHQDTKILGFAWDISYSSKVSNSHSAPVSGVTNWGARDNNKPSSYPGMQGRIWFRTNNSSGSNCIDGRTLTHTGTGGYGAYSGPFSNITEKFYQHHGRSIRDKKLVIPCPQVYSYDYKVFLDDWPSIQQEIESQKTFLLLKNHQKKFEYRHKFTWNDPETLKQDNDFIQTYFNDTTSNE